MPPIFKVIVPSTIPTANATKTTTTTAAANREFRVDRSTIGDQLVFVKSQSECVKLENTVLGTDEVSCFCKQSNSTFHFVMAKEKVKTGCYSVNAICPGKISVRNVLTLRYMCVGSPYVNVHCAFNHEFSILNVFLIKLMYE